MNKSKLKMVYQVVNSMTNVKSMTVMSALLVLLSLGVTTQAETLRKRYTFSYDRATRKASSMIAAKQARKQFLRDFLAAKFSPEITSKFTEDIDIALDPPDQYITAFEVVSEKINDAET